MALGGRHALIIHNILTDTLLYQWC